MEPQLIKSFIDAMAHSDLSELEFSQDGWTLRLARHGAAASTVAAASKATAVVGAAPPTATATAAAASPAPSDLVAPLYGVVHLRPSPQEPLFAEAGQAVRAGQTLCVIEAMKVFNEVRAERDAAIAAVLVTSGQEVDAGQPLFHFA
ncbi:acetyl-CoA carboxylase biotin carboxyl carrier protein [Variovorax ginsengisoli]|uniref:Biotin carboxyl carrier protein of acetyl-CoA carboxylase n=1 Tax=Variovorax ginsengisoli TaxID=363844 RepID=A0ABT9S938_9BURK|nr:acetyl-CoA carboxylase biotin carboxyl carrier protein subunit [Variovorax ginsengisoli]MDP9900869.1 acetyl-CoA carboxylase biotin carboxyl carrier protein [Variovorax ginsengisoli]